jgi:polysaccharide export outer membrane protein
MTETFLALLRAALGRAGCLCAVLVLLAVGASAGAAEGKDYRVSPGDLLRITVFQNPDLTLDARVSDSGMIGYPLLGALSVGGLTSGEVEKRIETGLRGGGFVLVPKVSVVVQEVRGNQVAVLGHVTRPGRYPLEGSEMRLTDMLALAGGPSTEGGNRVVVVGTREGRRVRMEVDVAEMFQAWTPDKDFMVKPGDVLFVERAAQFYVYGEVQRPGAYRLERKMTVLQGLAAGGDIGPRGTERGLRIERRAAVGATEVIQPKLGDLLQADDIIVVREALF